MASSLFSSWESPPPSRAGEVANKVKKIYPDDGGRVTDGRRDMGDVARENVAIRRAGLKPWPRLLHNLRASRETELAAEFPLHVVTRWLGNTPKIAMKHYLQVTEDDFAEPARRDGKSPNGSEPRTPDSEPAT